LISKAEDPVKILEQSVVDMQNDLVKLREAVAISIASQKRLSNQAIQAGNQSNLWLERAQLALKSGDEDLARKALTRKKTFETSKESLNNQLKTQNEQIETLKRSLLALDTKIADAKNKKDMLKARAKAAEAQQKLQNSINSIGNNSAMAAFEKMEEKVEAMEASSQAAAELAGIDLEAKFSALEGNSDIDDEMDLLKRTLEKGEESISLPKVSDDLNIVDVEAEEVLTSDIDEEIEELKKTL